jgi:cysteinyl-tRNA synthetase
MEVIKGGEMRTCISLILIFILSLIACADNASDSRNILILEPVDIEGDEGVIKLEESGNDNSSFDFGISDLEREDNSIDVEDIYLNETNYEDTMVETGDVYDYTDISTDAMTSDILTDTYSISPKRGIPIGFPWVSFYGSSKGVDIDKVASYFRLINIDADPDLGNFTDSEIQRLKNNGKNRVISYLNVGSCEKWRSYYSKDPPGFKSCVNSGALTTVYSTEYPDERWANLSNQDYQSLIVNYVAKRLADRGVDGFFLDNMEVVEHGPNAKYGPCDSKCSQGGLELVYRLREKFPDKLIVMQNATSDITLNGYTQGIWFPLLLDGVSHEEVYSNGGDSEALSQMKKWRDKSIMINDYPFWLGVEEYVGKCDSAHKSEAISIYNKAKSDGFNAYVTDESSIQQSPCFWE